MLAKSTTPLIVFIISRFTHIESDLGRGDDGPW